MFVLTPALAFGLIEREEDFAKSATRWTFGPVDPGVPYGP